MLRSILILTITLLGFSAPPAFANDTNKSTTAQASKPDSTATATTSDELEVRDVGEFFDESFNDLQEDLATAKENGKKALLIMFEMDECPFCHRMKTTILNRSDIQDYFKEHFYVVSVDIEGDVEMTTFQGETMAQKDFALKEHRVRATPVFQFIDLEGEAIKNGRLTGATKNAEEFMLLGQYVVEKQYENMPFFKYKREQQQ